MADIRITLIPGDGIGPEVTSAAVSVIKSTDLSIDWDIQNISAKEYSSKKVNNVLKSIKKSKVCLKGPLTTPIGHGLRSINVFLRQSLNLYANIRPCISIPGIESNFKNINLTIIRENTEDLYSGIELKGKNQIAALSKIVKKRISSDAAVSLKINTRDASKKLMKFAIKYAKEKKLKHLTIVHKANILKYSDGLFLASCKSASQRSNLMIDDKLVDNMAMQLVTKPQNYQILVCPNLYGDILSDLAAGITGGLGLAPSANIGDKCAVFEPVHGSAPKYAGKNKVNPTATIRSAVMLLHHCGYKREAQLIENAVFRTIKAGNGTSDISPHRPLTTQKMTESIIKIVKRKR